MRGWRSGQMTWQRRVGLAVLAVFVAVDIVLVVLAFRHVAPAPIDSAAAADPGSAPSDEGERSSPPEPRTAPAPSPEAPADAPSAAVLLALGPEGLLLRAVPGDCDAGTPSRITWSSDDGATFRDVAAPPELAEVSRISVDDSGTVQVVGLDAGCTPSVATAAASEVGRRNRDAGDGWTSGDADERWYLLPDGGATIHAPGGPVDTPCVPTGLSSTGSIRVLCEGGMLIGTSDAGQTWVALGRLEGAAAAAYDGPANAVALAPGETCPVAAFTTGDGGTDWTEESCLDGGETGPRAVAMRDDVAYAQVGDVLHRSDDGGVTWTAVG